MKKYVIIFAIMLAMMGMCACTPTNDQVTPATVSHYQLNDQEQQLLNMFAIDNNAAVFNFTAPEEAITLRINAYYLENGSWQQYGGGAISIGEEREPVAQLEGLVAIEPQEQHILAFSIAGGGGKAHYTTEPLGEDMEDMLFAATFLDTAEPIVIGEEIPIALYVYDDGVSVTSHEVSEYFNPDALADMALVQVITLAFSDEALN